MSASYLLIVGVILLTAKVARAEYASGDLAQGIYSLSSQTDEALCQALQSAQLAYSQSPSDLTTANLQSAITQYNSAKQTSDQAGTAAFALHQNDRRFARSGEPHHGHHGPRGQNNNGLMNYGPPAGYAGYVGNNGTSGWYSSGTNYYMGTNGAYYGTSQLVNPYAYGTTTGTSQLVNPYASGTPSTSPGAGTSQLVNTFGATTDTSGISSLYNTNTTGTSYIPSAAEQVIGYQPGTISNRGMLTNTFY